MSLLCNETGVGEVSIGVREQCLLQGCKISDIVVTVVVLVVQCLLSAAHLMSDREIVHALRIIVDADLEMDVIRHQMEIVQRIAKELNLGICNRECVMLILDKVTWKYW